MKTTLKKLPLVLAGAALLLLALPARAEDSSSASEPLKLVQVTSLPDMNGDFDHFRIDVKGDRLFLASEDHHSVEVFEAKTGKHLKSVGGFDTPHSVLFLPE